MNHETTAWIGALFVLLATVAVPGTGFAAEQKGVGEIQYGRSLNRDERDAALNAALRNAVETWVAEKHQSQYRNYERVKDEIDANIDDYVLSHEVINVDQDKRGRRLRVVVRANLNEPKLLDAFLSPSAAAEAGAYLTFVFVAREQVGTVSATEKSATEEKTRTQGISRERSEDTAGQSRTQTETVEVRTETRDIDDVVLWDVSTSNEIDSAMGAVFTDAQYRTVDPSLVGMEAVRLDLDQFMEDYRTGRDIRPDTKRDAYAVLSKLRGTDEEIQYFAIGTLDVESSTIDEATGNVRVTVAVTGEVWSVLERGSVVAKVGPVTMSGEGSSELMARNNALNLAARRAASNLVAQLSTRNIR